MENRLTNVFTSLLKFGSALSSVRAPIGSPSSSSNRGKNPPPGTPRRSSSSSRNSYSGLFKLLGGAFNQTASAISNRVSGGGTTQSRSAGVQSNSNGYGAQVNGVGVQTKRPKSFSLTEGSNIRDQFQPALDTINTRQQDLFNSFNRQFQNVGIGFQDTQERLASDEQRLLRNLDYDPETGVFSGLAQKEEDRISAPYDTEIARQNIQRADQLAELRFQQTQSDLNFAAQRRQTENKLDQQKLLRETFAGLTGAFGSSRTFEFMQEKEVEGQQLLNDIDSAKANASRYYTDKMSTIQLAYDVNVASLRSEMANQLNSRYDNLLSQVDAVRQDQRSSIRQKTIDINNLIGEYESSSTDLAAQAAQVMSEYNRVLRETEAQVAEEDRVLRDTIGVSILDVYDSLVPGFVPTKGKVQEFTERIYEGLELYEQTGGQEGYPNLQSGLADVMNAIRNSDVFSTYNPFQRDLLEESRRGRGGSGSGDDEEGKKRDKKKAPEVPNLEDGQRAAVRKNATTGEIQGVTVFDEDNDIVPREANRNPFSGSGFNVIR